MITREERRLASALGLRRIGYYWRWIAEDMGFSSRYAARRAVVRYAMRHNIGLP